MKSLLLIILLLTLSIKAFEYHPEKNGWSYKTSELDTIQKLSNALKKHFDDTLLTRMPKKILDEVRGSNYDYMNISGESLQSIFLYIGESADVNTAYSILLLWADFPDGYDNGVMLDSFTEYLKTKEVKNLESTVTSSIIRFKESKIPEFEYSPDGKNPITWLWKLKVKTREFGFLHVGIDEVKRNFICYEAGIGLYFPEGETLERIYTEIVQDPVKSGNRLGKGRKLELDDKNNKLNNKR